MAQTGCPHGTGTGGSGKKLKAEFNKEPHVRGTTSMARAASPDSGDSQFFICLRRRLLPQQPVHGLGQGHLGHGKRRQDQGAANRSRIPTRSSRRGWPSTRRKQRRHSGMVRRTRPGISRFRVRCFASPRNDDYQPGRHAHRSLRLRTPRCQYRAAARQPARFRAYAGGAAGRRAARPQDCRSAAVAGARRSTGRQRYQGDRGAAQRPPHRPRHRAENRGDADQAARWLTLAGAGQAGEKARDRRRRSLR